MIVQGKAYKQIALNGTGFTYFKAWARNQPQFQELTEKELQAFADKVNDRSLVYDKWQVISRNLADPRITEIDARRLSVGQLYDARDMGWCLNHNESLRRKSNKPDTLEYTEEKFNDIVNYIQQSGILGDISYQQHAAARLGERLKRTIMSNCRRGRRPNPY